MSKNNESYISKLDQIFNRVFTSTVFKKKLRKIRVQTNIPMLGFDIMDEKEEKLFYKWSKNPEHKITLKIELLKICKKHKLPPTILRALETYILYKDHYTTAQNCFTELCSTESENFLIGSKVTDEDLLEFKIPFVKIYITNDASVDDVKLYIENNWGLIESGLSKIRGRRKKIRYRYQTKRERNDYIYKKSLELSKNGIVKNGLDKAIKDVYFKDSGKIISEENIRKIISREKKKRSL